TICGPGLGGLLYAWSPAIAYGATTLGLACATAATFLMRSRPVAPHQAKDASEGDLASVLARLVLIVRNKLLLGAISLDLFAVLFSGATALIPVFAKDILGVGADAGGMLRTAQGIGAALTAIVLTQRPLERGVGRRLFVAVGIFGVSAVI